MSNVGRSGFRPVQGPRVRPSQIEAAGASQASAQVAGLQLGSRGPEVKKLQTQLQAIGLSLGKADGIFGRLTQRAVSEFQRAEGLTPNGIAGTRTQKALQKAVDALAFDGGVAVPLRLGSRGPRVGRLQSRLQALGYNPGTPDGIYGHKTENAVKRFQLASGLHADGIAGPATFAALDAAGSSGPASPPATAAFSDSDGINPGNLYATINGVDELLAKDSLGAWLLDGGRYVVWNTPDGAGGFENEGQGLNVFDTQTGTTKKIMSEYFPVDDVQVAHTSDGRTAFLVSMTGGGSGFPEAAIVDPTRGEVARFDQATLQGDGDRITVSLHGNPDNPSVVTGMGSVLLSAALDGPVITNPHSPI